MAIGKSYVNISEKVVYCIGKHKIVEKGEFL